MRLSSKKAGPLRARSATYYFMSNIDFLVSNYFQGPHYQAIVVVVVIAALLAAGIDMPLKHLNQRHRYHNQSQTQLSKLRVAPNTILIYLILA